MISENLKPCRIEDIIGKMYDYLDAMRSMESADLMEFVNFLEDYVRDYFEKEVSDKIEVKVLLVKLVDLMYQFTAHLPTRNAITDGYFGIVFSRLMWCFQQKGIFAFFVLDNTLKDDRFKMVIELFAITGFSVLCPYDTKDLEYTGECSVLPPLDHNLIEKEIYQNIAHKNHIFYLEKDSSVNYLNYVLDIAEEFQSEYVCIFRSKAPDGDTEAVWLQGSFGDYATRNQQSLI